METLVFFLPFFVVIAVLVRAAVLAKRAERDEVIDVDASPETVLRVLRGSAGFMWRTVAGDGDLNLQRRTTSSMEMPILSISVRSMENGTTRVGLWMSRWRSKMGIGIGAEYLQARRKKLIKALSSL